MQSIDTEHRMSTTARKIPKPSTKPSTPKLTIGQKSKLYFNDAIETRDQKENLVLEYKCKLCHREINGTKDYNLDSHLESVHSDVYYSSLKLKINESLMVKQLRILLIAVELVTVNGRPFNALLD